MLCISKTLVCDGIQHCPSFADEYDSDEDPEMCLKYKKNMENVSYSIFGLKSLF